MTYTNLPYKGGKEPEEFCCGNVLALLVFMSDVNNLKKMSITFVGLLGLKQQSVLLNCETWTFLLCFKYTVFSEINI